MGFPTPTKTLSTCCSASTTTYCHHCHHSGSVDLIPFPFQSFFCICIYLWLCPVRTNHPPLRCGIPFHVRAAWPAGTLTVQRTYRTEERIPCHAIPDMWHPLSGSLLLPSGPPCCGTLAETKPLFGIPMFWSGVCGPWAGL